MEVAALAERILPGDGGWVGWDDRAQAGQVIGQLNAPLIWGALGLLVAAGLPATPLYLAGAPLANAVFALGIWRLAGALLPGRAGPVAAALVGACMAQDLYGIGGATGGMWPFRLANGLLAWGMAGALARPRVTRHGPWLAAILLCHTFTGAVAFAWTGACALVNGARGRRREALAGAGAVALALGLAGAFWLPLLDGALRSALGDARSWGAWQSLAFLTLPAAPFDLQVYERLRLLGGAWSLPGAAALWLGVAAAVGTRGGRARLIGSGPLAGLIGLGLAALVLLLSVFIALTDWGGLGPNPWRFYAFYRIGLACAAGAGLGGLLERAGRRAPAAWAALTVALLAGPLAAGRQEIPRRAGASAWEAMEQVWAELAAAGPRGRVYVENTFEDERAPEVLRRGQVGALFTLETGLPMLGTWYGVNPNPTHPWTTSEAIFVMSARPDQLAEPTAPGWLYGRWRTYGVGAIVAYSEPLAALLEADPRYRRVSARPPFSAWVLVDPPQPMLGAPPSAAIADLQVSRGRVEARVTLSEGPAPFRLRQSYHPWWRATLDGEPIPLEAGEGDGLVSGTLPRSGALLLTWEDRARWARWVSLLSLGALALAGARGQNRRAALSGPATL